jgi:hypothetical protein
VAGVQITQEQLSAVIRAITRVSSSQVPIEKRVIARAAGSYSGLGGFCGRDRSGGVIYSGAIEQAHGQQRDDGKRKWRLSQRKHYAEQLDCEGNGHKQEALDRPPDTLGGKGKHANEIVEVIQILEQEFHGALSCN